MGTLCAWAALWKGALVPTLPSRPPNLGAGKAGAVNRLVIRRAESPFVNQGRSHGSMLSTTASALVIACITASESFPSRRTNLSCATERT